MCLYNNKINSVLNFIQYYIFNVCLVFLASTIYNIVSSSLIYASDFTIGVSSTIGLSLDSFPSFPFFSGAFLAPFLSSTTPYGLI